MRRLQFKFPSQIRISGWDFGSSARAMNQAGGKDSLMTYESVPTQADLVKVTKSTTERKSMSTKTSIKRIALVAVSALGLGMFVAVSPALAADATLAPIVSSQTMVRTDDATYDDTYTLPATGDLAAYNTNLVTNTGAEFGLKATFSGVNTGEGALVKVGYRANSTAAETLISTVAGAASVTATQANVVRLGTSVYLAYRNTTAGTAALGTPASGVYTITNGTDNTTTAPSVFLNLGRNAAPGLYTLYVKETTSTDYSSVSLMLADMPNSVRIRDAVSLGTTATRVGNGTLTYNVQVRDAGGRDSYLLGSERVRFAVSGGSGSGLSITTPALPTIGSGDLGSTATSRKYSLTATAASAAGDYTITGTMEGFATTWATTAGTATASIVSDASVTASGATRLSVTSAGVSSSKTAWSYGVAAADTTSNTASTGTASDTLAEVEALSANIALNYLPTTQRTVTLEARFATTVSGDAKFTVVNGNVSGIYDGAVVRLAPIQSGANYNYATITYTADYANADEFVLFSIAAASDVLETAVIYKNPVPGYIEVTDPSGADVRVAPASSNVYTITVLDIFGNAMGNTPVTFTTSAASRNASASYTSVTDATGVAKFTHADTYVGTDGRTTDAITVTAVNGTAITGTINVVYALATTAAIGLVVQQPGTPGTIATYDTTITTDVTKSVTVDDTPDSTNNSDAQKRIQDQLLLTATVTNAAGALIQGQPVAVTATDGVYFNACSSTVGEVATSVASRKTTRTCYTNSSGVAAVQAAFTKSGLATITLKSGDITKTYTVLVLAGTARVLTLAKDGNTVTAQVSDLRGNGVSGVAVSLSASGVGRFANGVGYNSVNTDANGKVSYDVYGTVDGSTTISASISSTTETGKLADATYGLLAGARTASVELEVTASNATTNAALDAANEATDAANAATDAANAAAEAADAATAAAQDAQAAVAALATQVASLIAGIKAQITTLTNLVIKIQKKVKA